MGTGLAVAAGASVPAFYFSNLPNSKVRECPLPSSRKYSKSAIFTGRAEETAIIAYTDSNGCGNGQSGGFQNGYMGMVSRSILNSFDHGVGRDRGYMYESILNMRLYLTPEFGFGGNGTFTTGGLTDERFVLAEGKICYFTNREISQIQIWYDPALSSGTFTVDVDGEIAFTADVNSSGTTGLRMLTADGGYISAASKVTITSTTGTKVITALPAIRSSGSKSPMMFIACQGSQGFDDFSTPARVAEMAAQVNYSHASRRKLIMCFLGTNHLIDTVGKQLSPDEYVCRMDNFVNKQTAALGGPDLCDFIFWVPAKPLVNMPCGDYSDYVDRILGYCAGHANMEVARLDETVVNTEAYYDMVNAPVGIHFNDVGHIVVAKTICDFIGIPLDARYPNWSSVKSTSGMPLKNVQAMTPWTGLPAPMACRRSFDGGKIELRGGIGKASGVGGYYFAQMAPPFRPSYPRVIQATDQSGKGQGILFFPTGQVCMVNQADALSTTQLFFDGVTFDI
jgi:hypothetical protein